MTPSVEFHIESFDGGSPNVVSADVAMGQGVVLLFVRGLGADGPWEVWGVKIDGVMYREPRDLVGDDLHPGPFSGWLDAELAQQTQGDPPVDAEALYEEGQA